jgi:hypothetical protein
MLCGRRGVSLTLPKNGEIMDKSMPIYLKPDTYFAAAAKRKCTVAAAAAAKSAAAK